MADVRAAGEAFPVAEVLVVDDSAAALRLLESLLPSAGLRVRAVSSGELALRAARAEPPDIVLLDVDMPGMDGYAVCRELKRDPALAPIPVLFLSALGGTEEIVKAFAAGGVDYVTKPFRIEELRARLGTHLELRRLQIELEAHNRELDGNLRRLLEVERLRQDLIQMVAHDMRSPLMGVSGYLELLELDHDQLSAEHQQFVARALESARALVRQVDAMLDAARLESQQLPLHLEDHSLWALLERAARSFGPIEGRRVALCEPRAAADLVRCDAQLIVRVAVNLIANALTHSDESAPVEVSVLASGAGRFRLEVRDSGAGIPPELRPKIFEKHFGKGAARGRTRAMGLGLAFCKLAIDAHGGEIGFAARDPKGTTFWLELPAVGPPPSAPE